MALSRVKTWVTGDLLTASDLNAEFNNILNNPVSLISSGSTWTQYALSYASTTGVLVSLGAATNGQLPIGSTGAAPVLAALTGTANQITVTNGAGTITLSIPANLILSSSSQTGASSFQTLDADFNPGAAFGTSTASAPIYGAGVMGNILGADLTKTANILAGVIGKYDVTGTSATTLGKAGVIGEIGDLANSADAAVLAILGGDSGTLTPGAAFGVMSHNSTPTSKFSYGLDLYRAAIGSFQPVSFGDAAIRLPNVEWIVARNAAGSANVNLIRLNASDTIEFGSSLSITNNTAMGRAGAIGTGIVLRLGGFNTDYDLTSAVATDALYGIRAAPTLRMGAAHDQHAGIEFGVVSWNDGSARTVTDQIAANVVAPSRDNATTTVTNSYSMKIASPTLGGSVNEVLQHANTTARLTTAGVWTDASSRDYKDILARLDTPASFLARLTELRVLQPVLFRYKPDLIVGPIRDLSDPRVAEIEKERKKKYGKLKDLDDDDITTDARWNDATQTYEAYRSGRWEAVGSAHKAEEMGILAEELPLIIRTKDEKSFNPVAGFAWLTEVVKALDDRMNRAGMAP